MKIAFGCDHAAFKIKDQVIEHLKKQGHETVDFGCGSAESCDYPDFGIPSARAVSKGECARGILICGTGIGMSMLANKIPGIRAAVCWNEDVAKLTADHNNANVLCLAARFMTAEQMGKCIDIWLNTVFGGEPRHQKRIDKIMSLEKDWKK
ncbi:MAG: ribose 5-phosphate isomerase B [Elusimicrobiota bacterium]